MPVKQSALRSALLVHRSLLLERHRTCRDILRLTSWGCVSAIDSNGRTISIADAHRDGKRFVVHAEEKLTAFIELESAIRRRNGINGALEQKAVCETIAFLVHGR